MLEQITDNMQQHYLIIRLCSCFLIGFWWCASGALLQWSTQNPLACPVTLGLTALPVSCWLIAYLLGLNPENFNILILLLIFVTIAHAIFYKGMKKENQNSLFSNTKIIMIGIGLNLSLAAIYSFFHFFYSAQGKVMPNALWFGMLKNMDVLKFCILFCGSLFFLAVIRKFLPQLSLLSLGRSYAQNVANVSSLEKKMLVIVSLLLCLLVFTGGVFAFWGLVLPHLVRKVSFFRGSLSREVYWGSTTAGVLMMAADFICYQFPLAGSELPVGLLSSILGPILLVSLIAKNTNKSPQN